MSAHSRRFDEPITVDKARAVSDAAAEAVVTSADVLAQMRLPVGEATELSYATGWMEWLDAREELQGLTA